MSGRIHTKLLRLNSTKAKTELTPFILQCTSVLLTVPFIYL